MTIKVTWVGNGCKAQNPPDPRYPKGIKLDISHGHKHACKVKLPYPSPECGYYMIKCDVCEKVTVITAAGRADDSVSVKLACRWMPPKGSKLK